jgi:hypothetical protein
MAVAISMHRREAKCSNRFSRKPEEKIPLGRPRHRLGSSIKMGQKRDGVCGLEPVSVSYRKPDESSSKPCRLFLEDPFQYYYFHLHLFLPNCFFFYLDSSTKTLLAFWI